MATMEKPEQPTADGLTPTELNEDELRALLPRAFVRDLWPALSVRALLRLIQTLPGEEVKVPATAIPGHRLTRALTPDEFSALIRIAKGVTIGIPIGAGLKTGLLHREMVRLAEQGCTRREIARRVGMTLRHVRQVLNGKRPKESGKQRLSIPDPARANERAGNPNPTTMTRDQTP